MNKLSFVKFLVAGSIAIMGSGIWQSDAQAQVAIDVDDIEFNNYQTPDFDEGRTHRSARRPSEDWLQIVIKFEAQGEDREEDWLDELTINWHVMIDGGETPRLYFQTSTTYVDIEYGEDQYAAVYIRPNTIRRHYSERRFPRERESVAHLQFLVNGTQVAEEAYNPGRIRIPEQWWNSPRMNRVANGLLPPDQTPFQWLDYEFYMTLKPGDD